MLRSVTHFSRQMAQALALVAEMCDSRRVMDNVVADDRLDCGDGREGRGGGGQDVVTDPIWGPYSTSLGLT